VRRRYLLATVALAAVGFSPFALRGQAQARVAKKTAADWTAKRTPWGHPDLQGLWNNSTTTPLERPIEFGTRQFLTDQEIAERDKLAAQRADAPPRPGDTGTYNAAWFEQGTSLNQTSLIVDPPNGRLPPLTPSAEKARAEQIEHQRAHPADSWEDRNLAERCLTRGAPKLPGGYNNHFLIVQTPDYVAILQEMIHEVRLIPLDGRPHLDQHVRQWMGDSRGRWDGDTLVVETTNYNAKVVNNSFNCCPGGGANMHIVERFRRAAEDTMTYTYTVDDPSTWTRSWTASVPMIKSPGPMYEYACHEGNHAMIGILRGARVQEAAKSRSTGSKEP
jgi:hypothetical protein